MKILINKTRKEIPTDYYWNFDFRFKLFGKIVSIYLFQDIPDKP